MVTTGILKGKFKEAFFSVLPITIVIIVINFILPEKMSAPDFVSFTVGALFMIVGMALYSLGSDSALSPIGESIGNKVTETKNIPFILLIGFIIGFIVTIAEPDLLVLGTQLGEIKLLLIVTIAVGVGLFLVLALVRIFFKFSLNWLLIGLYAIVFVFAVIVDEYYLPLSFDAGGVTTGPITVPFIMALGVGVAGVIGGKGKRADSFGVVAICSVGPILFVLLLSVLFQPAVNSSLTQTSFTTFGEFFSFFGLTLLKSLRDVAIAILPITAFFFIMNFALIKSPKKKLTRISVGLGYTFIGLTLFLTGINIGFMQTGLSVGSRLASYGGDWLILLISGAIGALMVLAEPAVHVLSKQVETLSNGKIRKRTILITLSLSVVAAVMLSMLRIIFQIPIGYLLFPLYGLAIVLSFFVPKVYTAIAFDSGGVASGPMATTFMLPFAIGVCTELVGNAGILSYAYGLVAFIALTPLISVQIMGLIVRIKEITFVKLDAALIEEYEGGILVLDVNR